MRSFSQFINEDAVVNAAGAGGVAGIGVGPQGEPGIKKSQMIRRRPKSDLAKIFMGMPKKISRHITTEEVQPVSGDLLQEPEVVRSKFAGNEVFQVPSEYFHKARMGKAKYAHYRHYVGTDHVGQTIRHFGNRHYGKPIIVQDEATQHMLYLRYGKGK
jgi:hypothetical protein